ncbi:MAG: hypothetical protein EB141_03935 [Verrucomicrobia bacterium]|nr:hypothetical protein [Verrucomicrobiota bacterium]
MTFVPAVTNTLTTSALTYQWQWATASNPLGFAALTNGSADGLTVSGATTATLSVTSASLVHDGDLFRLFVANAAGLSAYSNAAPLTVRLPGGKKAVQLRPAAIANFVLRMSGWIVVPLALAAVTGMLKVSN